MDVSDIRRLLNFSPQEGIAWFRVDEIELAFAPSKSPGMRPAILRSWPNDTPIAWVFARTSTGNSGIPHDPHAHEATEERCKLDKRGRIVTNVPLAAKKSVLDDKTAMCDEPDPHITEQVLAAATR